MKKTFLLFLIVFLLSKGITAQVTYNIGGHQILKESHGYIELYSNDSVLIDTVSLWLHLNLIEKRLV